jgi:hypothetical protein
MPPPIADYDAWHAKVAADVAARGFVAAFLDHFEEIVAANASPYLSRKPLGKDLIDWMKRDATIGPALAALPEDKAAALAEIERGAGAPQGPGAGHAGFLQALRATFGERVEDHLQDEPEVLEGDGKPMRALGPKLFCNWGRTVKNTPARTFLPRTKQGVCNIVKWAAAHKKRVRVAGYRHTWTELFSEDDEVLISMLPLPVAEELPASEPLLDPENELMGIDIVGEIEEDGRKKALCRIGAATTNEMFRRWAIGTMKWTVPLNVIMVEITWGGSNGPICHGAGITHQTLSDLVHEIEFVNAKHELQRVSDRQQLRAASGCFGLLGVVTAVTLKLDPMTFANMRPAMVPTVLAVPPPAGMTVPPALEPIPPPTQEQLDAAWADFILRAETDYYSEWFWFVFQEKSWVNTWKNDGAYADARDYPGPLLVFFQNAGTYLANLLNETVFRLLPSSLGWVQAQLLAGASMRVLPDIEAGAPSIVTPLIDALHFVRGIQNMRVLDMELEIPLPPRADDPNKPDWNVVRQAWWAVITRVYQRQDAHDYPMRLTMEMRIMADSNVIMAPERGNHLGTCSIEILTPVNVDKQAWQGFLQEILDAWAALTSHDGKPLKLRPHWAKQWQDLKIRGQDVLEYLRDVAYAEEIPAFRQELAKVAAAGGYKVEDLRIFANPLLIRLFAPMLA